MTLAALPSDERTLWVIALILGAVVLVAVIVLLQILLRFVQDIDRNVFGLWQMAKRVAANTATTWQLTTTAAVLEDIKAEALIHDQFLKEKTG